MSWKIIKNYLKQIRKKIDKGKKERRKKDLEAHGTVRD